MNGRAIVSGTGMKGINKINVSNLPGGIYVLQLFSNDENKQKEL